MENIEQAVERARAQQRTVPARNWVGASPRADAAAYDDEIALSGTHLHDNRIVSHVITDPRSRSFDMLRTQILQSMDLKDWRILAITSPTAGCGKTVTALNLAISIARQPQRSILWSIWIFKSQRWRPT